MGVRKMRIVAPCPACQEPTLEYTAADLDIPYFGDILQTVFECSSCGFRHADIIIGKVRSPKRCTFHAVEEDDMMVRVVRSTSGTVRIPELGVHVEPGPASEAFVSNVEGILVRVEAVLGQLLRDADDAAQRTACEERLASVAAARKGRLPITLILEDPYGNSAILHDRAKVEAIPKAEADRLPRGELGFELSELEGGEEPDPDGDGHRRPNGNEKPHKR